MLNSTGKGYSSLGIWIRWTVLSASACTLAWLVISLLVFFTLGLFLIPAGIILGLALGISQSSFLKSHKPDTDWSQIAPLTLIGISLSWITMLLLWVTPQFFQTSDKPPIFGYVILASCFLSSGLIFGYFQWLAMKKTLQSALYWAIINIAGWLVGGSVGSYLAVLIYTYLVPQHGSYLIGPAECLAVFIAGSIGCLVLNATTGIMIASIFRENQPNSFVIPG
jgi:hypothetical protein